MTVGQTEFAPKVISPPWPGLLAMGGWAFGRTKGQSCRLPEPALDCRGVVLRQSTFTSLPRQVQVHLTSNSGRECQHMGAGLELVDLECQAVEKKVNRKAQVHKPNLGHPPRPFTV